MQQETLPSGQPSIRPPGWSRLWQYWRGPVRQLAKLATVLFALMFVMALFWPGLWQVGPISVSLRTTRIPSYGLVVSIYAWCATSESLLNFVVAAWRSWGFYRLALLGLLGASGLLAVGNFLNYPNQVIVNWRLWKERSSSAQLDVMDQRSASLEHFAEECCRQMPPDARILYHGSQTGWVYAYEVYPRRVFMLPGEWSEFSSSWRLPHWARNLPDDPLDDYWKQSSPQRTVDRDTFIRQHGITHEVFFDEENATACRWEVLR